MQNCQTYPLRSHSLWANLRLCPIRLLELGLYVCINYYVCKQGFVIQSRFSQESTTRFERETLRTKRWPQFTQSANMCVCVCWFLRKQKNQLSKRLEELPSKAWRVGRLVCFDTFMLCCNVISVTCNTVKWHIMVQSPILLDGIISTFHFPK